MITIIHVLKDNKIKLDNCDRVINARKCNKNCIGCFNCWIKNPKKCTINDEFSKIVDFIKNSDELIIISECRYGCYSAYVKRVLERCIGYVLPYFTIRNKEIHHEPRYNKKIKLCAYFYGNIIEEDKICVYNLVKANAINLNVCDYEINYVYDLKEIKKWIH